MYHRVAHEPFDPWRLCVTPEHFAEQLEVLSQLPLGTIDDVVNGRDHAVAVTLDDAYTDTVETALPVIDRLAVPVTVYVTTQGFRGERTCWWDELADLVHASGAEGEYLERYQELFALTPDEQRRRLDALRERLDRASDPSARLLDEHGVRALAGSENITIGAHTVHHRPLPTLSPEERRAEIVGSVLALAELVGTTARHFAYPYGRYDDDTVETVRSLGLASAVTTDAGTVSRSVDVYRLPRVQVPDVPGEAFEEWVHKLWGGTRP